MKARIAALAAGILPVAAIAAEGGGESMKSQMGFMHMLEVMDTVGWLTLLTLGVMGLGSLYYIIVNSIRNAMIRSRADRVIEEFWSQTNPQDAIRSMEAQPAGEPFSKVALDCANAAAHHAKSEGNRLVEALNRSEFIDRALRQGVARESTQLENGLTLLATVGSTAPFVGLFGTVWGIYHALIRIGATGQASLDVVAAPVGEALIMTCIGLGVAIPAVLGYNFFVRANRVTLSKLDEFAHDLHDYFATGSRVGAATTVRVPAPRPQGGAAPAKA
jgi:biopolymer transport protein ExbB